jgi:hypothetical protein
MSEKKEIEKRRTRGKGTTTGTKKYTQKEKE